MTIAIIGTVKIFDLHDWQLTPAQAIELQHQLATLVINWSIIEKPHFIAGIDISMGKVRHMATGAVVILSYPDLKLQEIKVVHGKLDFPYIPGLLSFREAPIALAAFQKISTIPDLVMVDGHGIAHPRRIGLASHIGLFLNKPTIGCAKSLLCGRHEVVGGQRGDSTELIDKGETIGVALRTKLNTKPIYVSPGHKVGLYDAIYWVLACCKKYRLPEPTRLAHMAASDNYLGKEVGI